ncbi:MAG: DUF2817 domain-containing protein [Rhodoferax sp.]|nr:DUF2817 domain-containing protein [Rhodoferax sp.]
MYRSRLPELATLERVIELGAPHLRTRIIARVAMPGGSELPVYAIELGNPRPGLPLVGYFGGVHGLERIGAEVVISHLHSLVMRLQWDSTLHQQLETMRLLFVPIVNPGGMALGTRANPQGVDLMRNAPVQAQDAVPWLVGGQRLSARLPWYQGPPDAPMQPENQALCSLVHEVLAQCPFALTVDCHSGFGARDRLWFPFAHKREPITHLAELQALKAIFVQAHSYHRYVIEPQSVQYLAHGDVWDHLYLESLARYPSQAFLPLTLEMGSWLWIKKNPRQLFSRHGIFNPLIQHRQQRVLRQHQALLDFLARAVGSCQRWLPSPEQRATLHDQALREWY